MTSSSAVSISKLLNGDQQWSQKESFRTTIKRYKLLHNGNIYDFRVAGSMAMMAETSWCPKIRWLSALGLDERALASACSSAPNDSSLERPTIKNVICRTESKEGENVKK